MNEIEHLLAVEAIKQLKARYFRCLDTKDWVGLQNVFAPDIVADMRGETRDESGLVRGAADFANFIRDAVETLITVHHGHTPEIEILSSNTAKGLWAMEDRLWKPEGSASTLPFKELKGYGHYHETYEKTEERWRIKTLRLTRLQVVLL